MDKKDKANVTLIAELKSNLNIYLGIIAKSYWNLYLTYVLFSSLFIIIAFVSTIFGKGREIDNILHRIDCLDLILIFILSICITGIIAIIRCILLYIRRRKR